MMFKPTVLFRHNSEVSEVDIVKGKRPNEYLMGKKYTGQFYLQPKFNNVEIDLLLFKGVTGSILDEIDIYILYDEWFAIYPESAKNIEILAGKYRKCTVEEYIIKEIIE